MNNRAKRKAKVNSNNNIISCFLNRVPGLLKRNASRFAFRTRFLDDTGERVAFTQF